MLPRPTAEPMAAKMNAVRPEKAPRSALRAAVPAEEDVALMKSLRGAAPRGAARGRADDDDGPGKAGRDGPPHGAAGAVAERRGTPGAGCALRRGTTRSSPRGDGVGHREVTTGRRGGRSVRGRARAGSPRGTETESYRYATRGGTVHPRALPCPHVPRVDGASWRRAFRGVHRLPPAAR